MRDAQDEQATKTIEETQKQIQAYYSKAMRRIIAEFEATYDKLLNTAKDGKPPTVADLYKLDKYWQLQGQLRAELQKMGDKETVLLAEQFEKTFQIDLHAQRKRGDYIGSCDAENKRQLLEWQFRRSK